MSFHRITVIGYAGSEPEYQVTVTGKDYAYFPLYVNERHGNSERAYRYKIKTWNELSLIVKDHLAKGQLPVVEGTPFGYSDGRLMVADPLPAGFEIDNPNLMSGGSVANLEWLDALVDVTHSEFRQDRFLTAVDWSSKNSFRLAYVVRAVSPGTFHQPAAAVEDR